MDKENQINDVDCVIEEDQEVFEDALEETENDVPNKHISNGVQKEPLAERHVNKPIQTCKMPSKDEVKKTKAADEINNNDKTRLQDKLAKFKAYAIEDGIDKCIQSAFQLNLEFFKDEFEFEFEFCRLNYEKNTFYATIYGTMYFIKTWMSFEQPEIQKCLEVLNQCSDYVNSRRRVYSWSDMVKKANYNEAFTDEEVHAEIAYGELQILIGATTFIKDQNFSSLFRGALKFKQGYQSFKYCKEIYLHRTKWSCTIAKEEFKSNLLAGSGVFHLAIALAPPKVTQLLEFVGFTCDDQYALEMLRKSINLENTIKSNYALIVLLFFNCYTRVIIGYGDFQLDEFQKLVQVVKKRNPNSLFTNYFIAKELQLSGEIDKAAFKFKEIINTSKEYFKQINNACEWELLFLHAAKKEYRECARIADVLRKCSQWTPCVFSYIYGISLYMIKEQTGNLKLQDEIDECFREVPRLRRRLAGKSTPIEKLAMSKCSYYFANDRKLVLPLHELMFYFNLMTTFMRNKGAMNDNLSMVEEKLKEFDVNKMVKLGQTNDYCILLTLKASYLRHMKYPSLAIETLEKIFLFSKHITENHLLPFATQELAFCYIQLDQLDYAKRLFKSCINHSKYTAELMLHFRSHNALRLIKKRTKQELEQQANDAQEKKIPNSNSSEINVEVSAAELTTQ